MIQGIEYLLRAWRILMVPHGVPFPEAKDKRSLTDSSLDSIPHGNSGVLMTLVLSLALEKLVHGVAIIAATMRLCRASSEILRSTQGRVRS